MVWFDNETHSILGQGVTPTVKFKLGTTVVGLTVADNTRDTHTDYTKVIVKSPVFEGVYCYYYSTTSIDDDIKLGPRPEYATKTTDVDFFAMSKFPDAYRNKKFTMRCHFVASLIPTAEISVRHTGPVKIKIGDEFLPFTDIAGESVARYNGPKGDVHGELIYTCQSPGRCL
eukprot:IDg8422t1